MSNDRRRAVINETKHNRRSAVQPKVELKRAEASSVLEKTMSKQYKPKVGDRLLDAEDGVIGTIAKVEGDTLIVDWDDYDCASYESIELVLKDFQLLPPKEEE
jgi:hypothetical protein